MRMTLIESLCHCERSFATGSKERCLAMTLNLKYDIVRWLTTKQNDSRLELAGLHFLQDTVQEFQQGIFDGFFIGSYAR